MSDFHFQSDEDKIFEKVNAIVDAIGYKLSKKSEMLFMVINGDIANKGLIDEYKVAGEFFDKVNTGLNTRFPELSIQYIFSPGNHDCDFSGIDLRTRKEIVEANFQDTDSMKIKLRNYYEFTNSYEKALKCRYEDFYVNRYDIDNGGHGISFLSFNTVAKFDFEFNKHKLYLNTENLEDRMGIMSNRIVISLLHYGKDWLSEQTNLRFDYIDNTSKIVVYGHNHKTDVSSSEREKNKVSEIHLNSMSTKEEKAKSGFYFIQIDSNTTSYEGVNFTYKDDVYVEESMINAGKYFTTYSGQNSIVSINDEKYNELLNESFTIFNDSSMTYNNLFVPNTVTYQNSNGEEEETDITKISPISNDKVTVFVAKESYGKSMVLKYYFKEYFEVGLIPVYIKINKESNTIERILSSIDKFLKSYYENTYDRAKQNRSKIVLLLDHISFFKGQIDTILFSLLEMGYMKIIATFDTRELNVKKLESQVLDYELYDINEMSHVMRYELIN